MTAADISTRSEGKKIYRVESQNWVEIILVCQGSSDFFLRDLTFGVCPQDTNFALVLSVSAGADSLCSIFWAQSWPIKYCLAAGRISGVDLSAFHSSSGPRWDVQSAGFPVCLSLRWFVLCSVKGTTDAAHRLMVDEIKSSASVSEASLFDVCAVQ